MKAESITINLFVKDVKESTVFYASLLGMDLVMQVPERGKPEWTYLKSNLAGIMLQSMSTLPSTLGLVQGKAYASAVIYVKVTGIEEIYAKAKHKDCVVSDLETTFYAHKEFTLRDPDGYLMTIAEEIEQEN